MSVVEIGAFSPEAVTSDDAGNADNVHYDIARESDLLDPSPTTRGPLTSDMVGLHR